jgi:hypothetical protein
MDYLSSLSKNVFWRAGSVGGGPGSPLFSEPAPGLLPQGMNQPSHQDVQLETTRRLIADALLKVHRQTFPMLHDGFEELGSAHGIQIAHFLLA